MGTPWDRAADRYLEEWVPRFVPYHLDLVRELSLHEGQRVLVTSAGPGAEVLAVARTVGEKGRVRATDRSAEMVRLCQEQVARAGFKWVEVEQADACDTRGATDGWHAIVCAFGLWQFEDRRAVLESWSKAVTPTGKIGIVTWGPADERDPFELLFGALRACEPTIPFHSHRIAADRDAIATMFEDGGLALVRHTLIRHTVSFPSAEKFVDALAEGCSLRRVWEELGPERVARVAARFYEQVGGPTAPLTFEPIATLAIAALPDAEVELAVRSVRATRSRPPPSKSTRDLATAFDPSPTEPPPRSSPPKK